MTFDKMRRVLIFLSSFRVSGQIIVAGGGEVCLYPSSQLPKLVHAQMLKWGFVSVEQAYIYRPYKAPRRNQTELKKLREEGVKR